MNSAPWKKQAFIKLRDDEIDYLVARLEVEKDLPASEEWEMSLLTRLHAAKQLISQKKRPTVFDRLDEVDLGQGATADNIMLDDTAKFSYSWSDPNNTGAGYERLERKNAPNEQGLQGGHNYQGVYHPNAICETFRGGSGPGICMHCGITLF